MRGYSAEIVFQPEHIRLYRRAVLMVDALPDLDDLRCHEVARAVGSLLGLDVVDGRYGVVDHSWLEVPGLEKWIILDVYACGRLPMVQLVDLHRFLGHDRLYCAEAPRTDIRQPVLEMLLEVLREAGFDDDLDTV